MCSYYIILSFNLHLTEQSSIVSLILQRRAESDFIFKFQVFFFSFSPSKSSSSCLFCRHRLCIVYIHLGTVASQFHNLLQNQKPDQILSGNLGETRPKFAFAKFRSLGNLWEPARIANFKTGFSRVSSSPLFLF